MKAKKTAPAKSYELTFLLSASLSSEELKQEQAEIEKLVVKHSGKITTREDWGKKPLAYMIKLAGTRHTEAVYSHWLVELPTDQVQSLNLACQLAPKLMRHLLVVASDVKKKAAATSSTVKPVADPEISTKSSSNSAATSNSVTATSNSADTSSSATTKKTEVSQKAKIVTDQLAVKAAAKRQRH